jgi:hypothetical protein
MLHYPTMTASVTSAGVTLAAPAIFHHYLGPPRPKSNPKARKPSRVYVDVSPHIPFISIDDVLPNTSVVLDDASGEDADVSETSITGLYFPSHSLSHAVST